VAGSNAHLSGFRPKDILIQVENIKIKNIDDVKHAFKKYKDVKKRIYIKRDGNTLLLVTQ
jgi:serine protease Do